MGRSSFLVRLGVVTSFCGWQIVSAVTGNGILIEQIPFIDDFNWYGAEWATYATNPIRFVLSCVMFSTAPFIVYGNQLLNSFFEAEL